MIIHTNKFFTTFLWALLCASTCMPSFCASLALSQTNTCQSCDVYTLECHEKIHGRYCRNCDTCKICAVGCESCKAKCSICLGSHDDPGEEEIVLKCGHLFGDDCIKNWEEKSPHKDCPLCRAPIAYKICGICHNGIEASEVSRSYQCHGRGDNIPHEFHTGCFDVHVRQKAVLSAGCLDVDCPFHATRSIHILDAKPGTSLLEQAIRKNAPELIPLIVSKGAALNEQDADGNTPLHFAVERGFHDVVKILLEQGASADIQNNEGNTPLHIAALAEYEEAAQALLEGGANAFIQNNDLKTPLHIAADYGNETIAEALIGSEDRADRLRRWFGYNVTLNLLDSDGNSALDLAHQIDEYHSSYVIENGRVVYRPHPPYRYRYRFGTQLLLERHGARQATTGMGQVWTKRALKGLLYSCYLAIPAQMAYAKIKEYRLRSAVARGDVKAVKKFLKGGLSKNHHYNGRSLLHIAAEHGHTKMVKLLLKRGAQVNPLLIKGTEKLRGIDSMRDKYRGSDYDRARDWQYFSDYQDIPLHVAVEKNHEDIVDLLLENSYINAPRRSDLKTALHLAAAQNYGALAQKLLKAGASSDLKDASGKTPRDLAEEAHADEVLAEFDRIR